MTEMDPASQWAPFEVIIRSKFNRNFLLSSYFTAVHTIQDWLITYIKKMPPHCRIKNSFFDISPEWLNGWFFGTADWAPSNALRGLMRIMMPTDFTRLGPRLPKAANHFDFPKCGWFLAGDTHFIERQPASRVINSMEEGFRVINIRPATVYRNTRIPKLHSYNMNPEYSVGTFIWTETEYPGNSSYQKEGMGTDPRISRYRLASSLKTIGEFETHQSLAGIDTKRGLLSDHWLTDLTGIGI